MSRELRVGFVILAALCVLGGTLLFVSSDIFPWKGYRITASFPEIRGLTKGARVYVSGVTSGIVEQIELTPDSVHLLIRLQSHIRIPVDSRFVIGSEGLLGEPIIRVIRGKSERMLNSGEQVSGEIVPSLDTVIAELRSNLDQIHRTFGYVNDILGPPERREELGMALERIPQLFRKGEDTIEEIEMTAQELRELVAQGKERITGVSERMERTLETGDAILRENRDRVQESMQTLNDILNRIDTFLAAFDEDQLAGEDLRSTVVEIGQAAEEIKRLTATADQELFQSGDNGLPATVRKIQTLTERADAVYRQVSDIKIEGELNATAPLADRSDKELLLDSSFWITPSGGRKGVRLAFRGVPTANRVTLAPGISTAWGRVWGGIVMGRTGIGVQLGKANNPFRLTTSWWDEQGGAWYTQGNIALNKRMGLFFRYGETGATPQRSVGLSYTF
ncbi:MAG: MlaD family protein [Synergistales bacterium]|nr:MlaD family protein [Synergistales bacterium]